MPHIITLNKIHVKSLEVFRRQVSTESGELDDNDLPIMIYVEEWALRVKFDMFNAQGHRKNGEKIYSINDAREASIKNFMKPFVQDLKAGLDIQEGEDWSDDA